jgi:hypothetical protein
VESFFCKFSVADIVLKGERHEAHALNADPVNQILQIPAQGVRFSSYGRARTEQLFLVTGGNFLFLR